MKKLHATQTASKLKLSRFSFVKVFSLATAAIFLSNVFPIFSANLDFRNAFLEGVKSAGVSYPQSIISVAGLNTSRISKNNYLTVLNKAGAEKANARSDYGNFLIKILSEVSNDRSVVNILKTDRNKLSKNTLNTEGQYKQLIVDQKLLADGGLSPQSFPQTSQYTTMINVSNFSQNNLIRNMIRSEDKQEKNGDHVVMLGQDINANVSHSVLIGDDLTARFVSASETRHLGWTTVIGYNAQVRRGGSVAIGNHALITKDGVQGIAIGPYARVEQRGALGLGYGANGVGETSIAIGYASQAKMKGSIAIGSPQSLNPIKDDDPISEFGGLKHTKALGENAIAIGTEASALANMSMALGVKSQAEAESGIALGAHSLASVKSGISGYVPVKKDIKGDKEHVWKSTAGAVSVGNVSNGMTRQIVAVAAGTEDTDAVNVAQLKAVQEAAIIKGLKINTTGKDFADATADAENSIALGSKASVDKLSSGALAFGYGASVKSLSSDIQNGSLNGIALGTKASVFADDGVALGHNAQINGKGSIALGANTIAKSVSSVVIGTDAKALSGYAVALGSGAYIDANARYAVVLGGEAKVENGSHRAVAFGDRASVGKNAENALSLGSSTNALVDSGIALGANSLANVAAGVGGYDPSTGKKSDKDDSIWKSKYGALSIGDFKNGKTRQIVGVSAGTNDTDAVNVAQLKAVETLSKTGWNLAVNNGDARQIGPNSTINFVAVSHQDKQNIKLKQEDDSVSFDLSDDITVKNIEAHQLTFQDDNKSSLTLTADGLRLSNGPQITTGGIDASGKKITGLAKGTEDTDAVNKAQLDASLNDLSNNLQSEDSSVVHYDKKDGKTDYTSVTLGGKEKSLVGLHNVANGQINESSHDAINGSQLYSMSNMLASYFGGGARYENGQWINPTFKIHIVKEDGSTIEEQSYDDVAKAFAGVGTSITNIHKELKNEISQVSCDSLVKQDADTDVIAIGGEKSGTEVTLLNTNGASRTLSGVKSGMLSAVSTEAVNGSQLYSMSNMLASYFGGGARYENGQWTGPTFRVTQFFDDGTSNEKTIYDNVAAAFDGISGSMSRINDRITDISKNVAPDGLNWNSSERGYDGRHNGEDSKIKHVADGLIEEGSKEVVNGGQLWKTNDRVSKVENKVDSIGQQLKDIAVSADGAVKYDKDKDGHKTNKITLVGGNESDPVVINNVGDGKIEGGSKEAINGGQLYNYTEQQMKIVLDDAKKYTDEHIKDAVHNGVAEAKSYTDIKFETLNYAVEDVRKEARQAAAIGLAVSNLRYNDTPGKLSVAIGSGMWLNQSAFAVGAGYTSEDGNIRSNLSVTSTGERWGVGVGLSLTLN